MLEQFTQQAIYVYQNFKIFHNLTDNLQDLYSYNDRLSYFRNCVEKITSNVELLSILDFNLDNAEIIKTFSELEINIKEKIDLEKLKANLSDEKIKQFTDATTVNIIKALETYKTIENEIDFLNVDDNIISSINGELIVSSKSSFTKNDIPNMNFDSVYSQHIANNKIKYLLPNTFLVAKTSRYLIERKQLIEGLDRIIKKSNNKIIILIRPNFDSRELIKKSKYQDIVIEIPSSNNHLNDTFFILDKKYLPKFESKDLPKEEREKFRLNLLDDNYKLYSNVIDINLPRKFSTKRRIYYR